MGGSGTTSAGIKWGGSLPSLPKARSALTWIICACIGGASTINLGGDKSGGKLIKIQRTKKIIEKHKKIRKGK